MLDIIIGLSFSIFVFITLNLVLHILVLFKEQPEHLIKLFTTLNVHFLVSLHGLELLPDVLNALDISVLKLTLVGNQILVRTG